MRDESLDHFAQRRERFVDRNAFLRAVPRRLRLFKALASSQIHKVDLAAQSAFRLGYLANRDRKDGVTSA